MISNNAQKNQKLSGFPVGLYILDHERCKKFLNHWQKNRKFNIQLSNYCNQVREQYNYMGKLNIKGNNS